MCKLLRCHTDASHSLYALDDASAYIALGEFSLPCLKFVKRQVGYMAAVVDWSDDFGIVGYFDSQRSASVERFHGREHTFASVGERSQLQCVLIGLGATVDKEQLIVVVSACFTETLGKKLLQLVDH